MKNLLPFLASGLYGFARFGQVYWASNAISTADPKISQVTLVGNSTTLQTPLSPNGAGGQSYTNFTALPAPELSLGLSYNLNIQTRTSGGTQHAKCTKAGTMMETSPIQGKN